MKRIFAITGAGGHLGHYLVQYLLDQNQTVRALLFNNEEPTFSGANVFYGDITDISTLRSFLKINPDEELIVIHAAGIVSINARVDKRLYEVNVKGTKNMLSAAKEAGAKRFVYISSVHAIKEKKHNEVVSELDAKEFTVSAVRGGYAKTKAEATKLVLAANDDVFATYVIAPSGILGPGNSYSADFLGNLVTMFVRGKFKVAVKGGYDFVDVRDVAQATINLALLSHPSRHFYLASGNYYSVKTILDTLSVITKKKRVRIYLSPRFIKLFAWIIEAHYRRRKQTPLFTAYSMDTLLANAQFDNQLAVKELKLAVRPLDATLNDMVKYIEISDFTASKKEIIGIKKNKSA